jgi:hypothetical protein
VTFSATLRNEVDLNQLSEQLLLVVKETMQPAHVSLWLNKPERKISYGHATVPTPRAGAHDPALPRRPIEQILCH